MEFLSSNSDNHRLYFYSAAGPRANIEEHTNQLKELRRYSDITLQPISGEDIWHLVHSDNTRLAVKFSSVMNFLGIGQSASIDITLNNLTNRKLVEVKSDQQQTCLLPVFYNGESISGQVTISLKRGSKLEYQGIKIELIGYIDFFSDRGSRDEFLNRTQELARPGILSQASTTYPFLFDNVEMPFESYSGSNINLRYFLRLTVVKRFMDLTKELDILVHSHHKPQQPDINIQMEVGIEDSLHIEFEYNASCYHLEDVIVGKIYFLLVRVKIKYMEVQILRRESTGLGAVNTFTDMETLAKFEIMDGAPVRGECIPIRLFLGAYDLTPTMKDVNRKFSVRYYLNLVLLDEEERRYYKQHEIFLFRRPDKRFEALMQSQQAMAVKSQPYSLPLPTETIPSTHPTDVPVLPPPPGDNPPQSSGDGPIIPDVTQNGNASLINAASRNDTNGIEDDPTEEVSGEIDSFSKELDKVEEKADGAATITAAVPKCESYKKEGEEQVEVEIDVFSGLSDHEDACDDGLSREQRSFTRYESPRDAEGREEEGNDGAAKETVTKPSPFDSPISAIT
ncbi:Vacuolar protein sorting-associated protein 26 [Echinococcus granulosus]|uniref:Vacuolar protein sorting-associated protein 26 n=2 Tax=Echinococcus granulosus TaxID=6210 RepID=W6URE9_ECHGR|nr:Vacuolar protein sorting-associated protein 26 [Echinococcus granulosus]EUB60902.1 Vacuolar protein sorting-associated protein 26 [Echinococcus granulosus]